ncbi:TQO small subunit DoxD [Dyella psychrodurans]|uniref:Quinol oxidase n=1 Tax=Dyella psychrodurans TaxID=1927960 RepID=A0A370X739_9GAMM|nr:TQO small subunit DoxD [Dyella psychrodurans]RDS84254.1 quinol oxidase [Dyella psychrodurans]
MNTSLTIKQNAGFQQAWRLAAIALVAVRFVQGWIYWGGGSRRFFYAPSKLNPHAPHWMAYKFQTAMPGALFGMDHVVSWLLQHFVWLYTGVIVFSAAELIVGLMLITGTLTRLAAAFSIGLAFTLMLLFGWQGATCIDEWTMAACNFAMGITLVLAGGGAWSVDSWLARTRPHIANARWFQWLGGTSPLPVSDKNFGKLSGVLLAVTVIFIVGTYSYFRGSVVTPFHGGPVSPTAHHWSLSEGQLTQQGAVTFKAYVDAGTPEAPSDVVRATLSGNNGVVEKTWTAEQLAKLPKQAFHNDYDYQKIHTGPFGLVGPIGSMATVTLPADADAATLAPGRYTLQLTSVNGRSWTLPLTLP